MPSLFEKYYNEENDIWGKPQVFRNIEFHPLKIFQQKEYRLLIEFFSHVKEKISDREIIRMSYLKFLIYVIANAEEFKDRNVLQELIDFLKIVTCCDDVEVAYKGDLTNINALKLQIYVGENKLTESDFDVVRQILLTQNNVDITYLEEYQPDFEKALMRKYDETPPTFSERVFSLSAALKVPIYEIENNFTIYQFEKTLQRLNVYEDYNAFKGLEMAGFVELKNGKIPHWTSHIRRRKRYEDILIKKQSFIDKSDIMKVSKTK